MYILFQCIIYIYKKIILFEFYKEKNNQDTFKTYTYRKPKTNQLNKQTKKKHRHLRINIKIYSNLTRKAVLSSSRNLSPTIVYARHQIDPEAKSL